MNSEADRKFFQGGPIVDAVRYSRAMERLLVVVQELSTVRDLDAIMQIVRLAARELTEADGATFVLRDGNQCHYAEENAIGPLWKGRRFPMSACISGWVMTNREAAVIEDIYVDPRIPHDAYRPTFVKSLVMVPIRTSDPLGAIGNYWAKNRMPTPEEVRLLQALANTTAVAIENVNLLNDLEKKVEERTIQLQVANEALESFAYSVSHDLRSPLRAIGGFSQAVYDKYAGQIDEEGSQLLASVCRACRDMENLIQAMLEMSRMTGRNLEVTENVSLSDAARRMLAEHQAEEPKRHVQVTVTPDIAVRGDHALLEAALQNLLDNAWKFSAKTKDARIEFGKTEQGGKPVFYVRDNGAGFKLENARKLFAPFQRMHSQADFPGTGIGLATVQRIVQKHGGRIWVETEPDKGATFFFTLWE